MAGAFIIFGLAVLAVALVATQFTNRARTRRALRNAPRTTIADFPKRGPGKIVGTLTYLGQPLQSPLTGRPCAYYQIVVEERVSSGNNTRWVTRIREQSGQPFQLADSTGRAIVDPSHAQVAIGIDSHSRSGTFDDATPAEEAFLTRHGKSSTGWMFNRALRYKEGVLEAGEKVAALGFATAEPDPEATTTTGGYRGTVPTRLRMHGTAQHPLLLSDELDTLR